MAAGESGECRAGKILILQPSQHSRKSVLAAYLPTRVMTLRLGLRSYPGAGTAAGATNGFALGAGPRDMGVAEVAVAGELPRGLSDARRFAGARVVGRRLCIAIFEGGERLL